MHQDSVVPATPSGRVSKRSEQVASLWRAGATYREIAEALNMTPSIVSTTLHRLRQTGIELPNRKARIWTSEDEQRLVATVTAGAAIEIVARELGRSPRATARRLAALRPRNRSDDAWSQSDSDRLCAGYRAGATFEALAKELGVSVAVVADHIGALREGGADLPPRKPRWSETERQRLATRYREGASLSQLEREFKRTRGTITSQLRTVRRLGYDLARPTKDPQSPETQ